MLTGPDYLLYWNRVELSKECDCKLDHKFRLDLGGDYDFIHRCNIFLVHQFSLSWSKNMVVGLNAGFGDKCHHKSSGNYYQSFSAKFISYSFQYRILMFGF